MNLAKIISLFNLREIEIDLYERLFFGGPMGATELALKANLSRTSIYDLLGNLIEAGIIFETMKGGKKLFSIQRPQKLELLLNEQKQRILEAEKELDEVKRQYNSSSRITKPRLQLYEGRAELQQMMRDLLMCNNVTVLAIWPQEKMLSVLTPSFMSEFHRKRVERGIKIKVIWLAGEELLARQYNFLMAGPSFLREMRVAPKQFDFTIGYSIYGDMVRFISSAKENFGFLVESKELAKSMRSQFELIWGLSKSIKM